MAVPKGHESKLSQPPKPKQGPGNMARTQSWYLTLPITPRRRLKTPVPVPLSEAGQENVSEVRFLLK